MPPLRAPTAVARSSSGAMTEQNDGKAKTPTLHALARYRRYLVQTWRLLLRISASLVYGRLCDAGSPLRASHAQVPRSDPIA